MLGVLKAQVAAMKVTAFEPGDKFKLPGGTEMEFTAKNIDDDHKVLLLEGAPLPMRLYKANGYWWVDIGSMVAARKGAAKAREKSIKMD